MNQLTHKQISSKGGKASASKLTKEQRLKRSKNANKHNLSARKGSQWFIIAPSEKGFIGRCSKGEFFADSRLGVLTRMLQEVNV